MSRALGTALHATERNQVLHLDFLHMTALSDDVDVGADAELAARYRLRLAGACRARGLLADAEYESLRARFLKKKHELSLAEDELGEHDRRTGAWTRKVFDLELEEPCEWRNGYERLRRYREERGRLPPSVKKARDEEERSVSDWLHQM